MEIRGKKVLNQLILLKIHLTSYNSEPQSIEKQINLLLF